MKGKKPQRFLVFVKKGDIYENYHKLTGRLGIYQKRQDS